MWPGVALGQLVFAGQPLARVSFGLGDEDGLAFSTEEEETQNVRMMELAHSTLAHFIFRFSVAPRFTVFMRQFAQDEPCSAGQVFELRHRFRRDAPMLSLRVTWLLS